MGLNADLVGKEYESGTFEVTTEGIEKYARATNDLNERYLGGDDVVASPIFPIVPAFEYLGKAALDSELNADVMRLVHGEEEHVLLKPVKPGDTLTLKGILESVEQKETGETFTVKVDITNQNAEPVAEIRATSFIRGSGGGGSKAPSAETEQRDVVYEESTKVDDDQTHRYADASGDHNPIHLDENTAKMVGLPGIINHGMCTMAIATKAAVDGLAGGDPTRIKRVSVRFSKPVLPGQELTTKFWKLDDSGNYGFETYNPDGQAVIKNGRVEIS
ncbi:MAG: (3R)-3-hydroxyacyl-CoA dehydrogenase / 3a,7a,12a-trihydroxy-5b-cholest-24-enoyl-CoA hydratase [Actinomycetota bacterium]|jgi:acyl dehydratase|nr:(3R)-3-hydroxyacyl-CoA dehydrogenase / 3a,7a,12a-trihydroxy-5b-cholest-24-enoyl-CoA hydratase [Actinomycetota bacterium]